MHFWPGHSGLDQLHFEHACYYKHSHPISEMVVGDSGTYVLIVVREGEGYLGVLHFSAMPAPHVTFQKFDTGALAVTQCSHFAFDESLGLILAADKEGKLAIISYA